VINRDLPFNGTVPSGHPCHEAGPRAVRREERPTVSTGGALARDDLPNQQDGVPGITQKLIRPGRLQYDGRESTGTHWYHAHSRHHSQVWPSRSNQVVATSGGVVLPVMSPTWVPPRGPRTTLPMWSPEDWRDQLRAGCSPVPLVRVVWPGVSASGIPGTPPLLGRIIPSSAPVF